jgi:hypothetical protein
MAAGLNGGAELHPLRVGGLRPNQLLHTYGVGAMADLPNLSVVMLGLDFWNLEGRSGSCWPIYARSASDGVFDRTERSVTALIAALPVN